MTIQHRLAVPADLACLGAALDQEFIFGKGRKTSFAQRFPSTFCAANAANIFVTEDNDKIVSAFLVKRFGWQQREKTWRGAMIGAVYTDAKRRGEGLAGNLLQWGTQNLRDAGVEFAVLWTTQSEFYARLGWVGADQGVFGSSAAPAEAIGEENPPATVKAVPLALSDERRLEMIGKHALENFVVRSSLDYHQVPLPAENVDVLLRMEGRAPTSYALLGSKGEVGILYEMVGSEDGFADLWQAICKRHSKIVINDRADSPSHRWLVQHAEIAWENKQLAMWLPLASHPDITAMSQWYIPYFDRI
jgi:predicted N-acetyltransferase YhbS